MAMVKIKAAVNFIERDYVGKSFSGELEKFTGYLRKFISEPF